MSKKRCEKCVGEVQLVLTPDLSHYGKYVCKECGKFLQWVKKPENEGKYKRPNPHKHLVKKFSAGFCEICLRREEQLPDRQVLEAHHIFPFKDAGLEDRTNILIVCTMCHRQIEFLRTYLGHYHPIENLESLSS